MKEALQLLDALCSVRAGSLMVGRTETQLLRQLHAAFLTLNPEEWVAVKKLWWRQWPDEVAKRISG